MTTKSMGFQSNTPPGPAPDADVCDHRDKWSYRDIGSGMAIQWCEGCGLTYTLVQNNGGAFLLVEVPRYDTAKWDEVSLADAEIEEAVASAVEKAAEAPEALEEALEEAAFAAALEKAVEKPKRKRRTKKETVKEVSGDGAVPDVR